jgi:hypothetical protein
LRAFGCQGRNVQALGLGQRGWLYRHFNVGGLAAGLRVCASLLLEPGQGAALLELGVQIIAGGATEARADLLFGLAP